MASLIRTAALIAALLMACPASAARYRKLSPEGQKEYYGTQPGYHRLSDSFAVEVKKRLMTFYYLGASGTDERVAIGVIFAMWNDYSDYGPRYVAYAISADGRRLVYFDEPGAAKGGPIAVKHGVGVADLYRFDADKSERELIHREIHRRGFSCIDFPDNVVRFSQVQPGFRFEHFTYSTEGGEISVDERDRKLVAAGRADQICGPF